MRVLVPLLMLAACGPKPKFPSDDRADRTVIDCPTEQARERLVDRVWEADKLGGGELDYEVSCNPLFAHEPLWLLYGWLGTPDGALQFGTSLVTAPGGEPRWNELRPGTQADLETGLQGGILPVDLDGDAHDELLSFPGKILDAGEETWVIPYKIVDGQAVAGPRLDMSTPGCEVTDEVIDAPRGRHLLQVTFGEGCEQRGVKTYGWDGQQLVEE